MEWVQITDSTMWHRTFKYFRTSITSDYHLNGQLVSSLLIFICPLSHGTMKYTLKAQLHRDLMGNFFNNGPSILKLIVKSSYISYINIHLEKKYWFENWIFKNFFLKIYGSQTDYNRWYPLGLYVNYIFWNVKIW
jgi:hypothetical protein